MTDKLLQIESMDLEAQGVAHREDGKVVFVEGALPFEAVRANIHRKKNNWEMGSLLEVVHESSQRVRPGCPNFGLHAGACGGCKMQHLEASAQVAVKQRAMEDNLWHLGKVKPENILRPIYGPAWGYRYRARMSVRDVLKKGVVLVGFHERKSRYVADMQTCPVLPAHVNALLMPLRALIESMQARANCPQIELACGDHVTALVLRHLEPLSASDIDLLKLFATKHHVQWWLQCKGPDTVTLLEGQVWGIEGSEALVKRARDNLEWNQAQRKTTFAPTQFAARNLFDMTPEVLVADGMADKWLVDPPREGAFALVQALAALHQQPELRQGWKPPKRIVYVSCNPATLARDAGLLVNVAGYVCSSAGAVNMFPHTAHVESMAVFDLPT